MISHGLGLLLPELTADSWWNPADWLKGIGGLLQGAYDQATSVKDALGGVLTLLAGVFRFFTDTGGFLADAVAWLGHVLFPPELQTWFLGTVGYPVEVHGRWEPTSTYEALYRVVQAPALLVAATSAALRLLRLTIDARVSAQHALVDVLPRFLACAALIGIPGVGVGLGYSFVAWGINASVAVAAGLASTFLHASVFNGVGPGQNWFEGVLRMLSNRGHGLVVVTIGFIPLLILLLYAAFLLVVRTIMIGFCVATAPLCFATAAFDAHNRFLQYWVDMFVGAAMTPVILGTALSVSLTLASSAVSALVVGPVLAIVILCGGVWMSGKLVHGLTWRHFSHGGAVAGFAAGVAAVLAPVQRLAPAGFLAEALGANAAGGNRVVDAMKRLGTAAQGLHPGPPSRRGVPSLENAAPVSLGSTALRFGVVATGGPPPIRAALSPAGQHAVEGAGELFDQRAFDVFAGGHHNLIGALTLDRPYGAMTFGDRAKLAWERVSPRSQGHFADEYLSHWLGGDVDGRGVVAAVGSPAGVG